MPAPPGPASNWWQCVGNFEELDDAFPRSARPPPVHLWKVHGCPPPAPVPGPSPHRPPAVPPSPTGRTWRANGSPQHGRPWHEPKTRDRRRPQSRWPRQCPGPRRRNAASARPCPPHTVPDTRAVPDPGSFRPRPLPETACRTLPLFQVFRNPLGGPGRQSFRLPCGQRRERLQPPMRPFHPLQQKLEDAVEPASVPRAALINGRQFVHVELS